MKGVALGAGMAVAMGIAMVVTTTIAVPSVHADDMAEMISRYRREHGLSTVKTDPQLTAIAERQAKAMAASGVMDHSVAGSFSSRISDVRTSAAAENIAAGTHSWSETFRMWQASPGHNANLLQSRADAVGVAVARNEQTRFKTYWAMVIAEKSPPKPKERKVVAEGKSAPEKKPVAQKTAARWSSGSGENPFSAVKSFVCKYLCP